MAYQNDGRKEKKLTKTFGQPIYGGDKNGPKRMDINYLESNVELALRPPLPVSQQTDYSKYDNKGGNVVYLSKKTCAKLAKAAQKAMDELLSGQEVKSRGTTQKNNFYEIAIGSKYGLSEDKIVFAMHLKLNDKKIAETVDVFEFGLDGIITDYDPSGEEASYGIEMDHTDLESFIDTLTEFKLGVNNARNHTTRTAFAWQQNRMLEIATSLAQHAGILGNGDSRQSGGSNYQDWSKPSTVTVDTTSDLVNEISKTLG